MADRSQGDGSNNGGCYFVERVQHENDYTVDARLSFPGVPVDPERVCFDPTNQTRCSLRTGWSVSLDQLGPDCFHGRFCP